MKKKQIRDTVAPQPNRAPVPWFEISRTVYEALGRLYAEHKSVKPRDYGALENAFASATADDAAPMLRRAMKQTSEEERDYAIALLRLSDQGVAAGTDDVFDMIRAERRLRADLQVLIDLIGKTLEAAGSRIDWDKRPDSWEDQEADEDPVDIAALPEIP